MVVLLHQVLVLSLHGGLLDEVGGGGERRYAAIDVRGFHGLKGGEFGLDHLLLFLKLMALILVLSRDEAWSDPLRDLAWRLLLRAPN